MDHSSFVFIWVTVIVAAIIAALGAWALFTFLEIYLLTTFGMPHSSAVGLTVMLWPMMVAGAFGFVEYQWRHNVREEDYNDKQ